MNYQGMTVKITEMGNAAFDEAGQMAEAARILRGIADKLEAGADYGACIDANGNTVGKWHLTEAVD